jgi:hypothetical protein
MGKNPESMGQGMEKKGSSQNQQKIHEINVFGASQGGRGGLVLIR